MNVTLTVDIEDAEQWLRTAAERAAKYGALVDHVTRKTYMSPWRTGKFDDARDEWRDLFRRNKRIVEAFGVEYEPTSEPETMTVYYEHVGGKVKTVNLGGPLGRVGWRTGAQPDYKHPKPCYRGGVHDEACKAAAERVVRRWREGLNTG